MACSGKFTLYCFLLIFMMFCLSASYTVEEICARRCLYGRGGVLCNCNARHFTGKRSGFLPEKNIHIKDFTNPEHFSTFLKDGSSQENSDSYDSHVLQDHDLHPQDDNLGSDRNFVDDLWQRQQPQNSLPKMSINTDANILGSIKSDENAKENEKAESKTTTNDDRFHIIFLQNDEGNDSVANRARKKSVSNDKKIGGSDITDGNTVVFEDSNENVRVANEQKFVQEATKTDKTLAQLDRILRRTLLGS